MAEENKSKKVSGSVSGNLNTPQTIEEMEQTLRIAKCLQGEPVCVLNERIAPQPQPNYYAEVEKWAIGIFKNWGYKAINPELGEIELNMRSIKDSNAHRLNPFKAEAYRAIKDVIEQGVVFAQTKVGKEDHYFISAPVEIENQIDLVTVLVHRNIDTQKMYLHSVMIREKILEKVWEQKNTLGYPSSVADTLKNEPEPQGKLYPRDTGRILQNYLKVNIRELEVEINQQIEQQKGNKMDEMTEQTVSGNLKDAVSWFDTQTQFQWSNGATNYYKQEAQFIVDTVTKYPHKDGEPFVAISGSEYPAFYPLNDKLDKVSIQAAEMIFVKLDGQMDGYYKTDVRVFNHSGELLAERHYDLGDRNGGLFNLLVEDERQIDNALQLSQYLPKDEQMNLLDRIDKQMEVDNNYAMAYPEVKEERMTMIANRGVFFERLQQQILQQDKTVEQHLSEMVDEVVAIANQHNQEQVLNEYMQLKADIRENETQQSEIWGSEEFVDEMKSLQEKHDQLMTQKTQIEKDYPTIWQDAERLEQQQMAEIGQADQDNSEIIKNTEFGRQAEKIFQSTAENLQKIENTADERSQDILSKHSVYIEALKKDFQYWVDIGDYDKATERLGDIRINQQMFDKRIEQKLENKNININHSDDLIRQPESISHAGTSQTTENEAQSTTGNAKDETRQKYEQRIDELFSGSPADYSGVHIMEHSDVMDLLGYGDYFLQLNERKVNLNIINHPEMTQEQWKKLPDWLDNPAAVIFSRTVDDRLVFVPDEDINGAPVFVIVEPEHKGLNIHLVVNAYARDRKPQQQFENIRDDIANGNCVFVDTKRVSNLLDRSQLQLLGLPSTNANHDKILTENDLEVYRNNRQVDINQAIRQPENNTVQDSSLALQGANDGVENRQPETKFGESQNLSGSPEQKQSSVDEPKNFVKNQTNNNETPKNLSDNSISDSENSIKSTKDLIENLSNPAVFQKEVMFNAIDETIISKMIDDIAKERTYLAVDFDNKDAAKAAGAKYDPQAKGWYAVEVTPELRQFLPQQPENITAERRPYTDLMANAQKIGVDLNNQNFKEEFDKWIRVPLQGKGARNTDGGYKLFRNEDGTIGGCVKNYSTNDTSVWNDRIQDGKQIQSKVPLPDYLANKRQQEWNTIAKHNATQQVYALRSETATAAYHQLQPALPDDPYIKNKGIAEIGKLKRLDDGSTIVPLYNNGKLANLQMIPSYDSSQKRMMTQAAKVGAYYSIGNTKTPSVVIVAEGVATADSVHQIASEIYGKDSVLTLSAVDSGNLPNVAAKVQHNFPNAQKIVAADNDALNATRAELKYKNAGLEKANEVKQAFTDFQVALCPALTDEKGVVKNTDWNDFLKANGKTESVKAFSQNEQYIAQHSVKQQAATPQTKQQNNNKGRSL